MSAFLLMLGIIGAAVWFAWASNMDRYEAECEASADAADDEWLGAA